MESTFEDFYEAHAARIQAVLQLYGRSPHDAADDTADAFVRAWERWDRVGRMARPESWVMTVAFNIVRRKARRWAIEKAVDPVDLPAGTISGAWPDIDLTQALRHLSARQRQAVLLRYSLGLSERECASAMGVREGTASATLAQARSRLASLLGDRSNQPNGAQTND